MSEFTGLRSTSRAGAPFVINNVLTRLSYKNFWFQTWICFAYVRIVKFLEFFFVKCLRKLVSTYPVKVNLKHFTFLHESFVVNLM